MNYHNRDSTLCRVNFIFHISDGVFTGLVEILEFKSNDKLLKIGDRDVQTFVKGAGIRETSSEHIFLELFDEAKRQMTCCLRTHRTAVHGI